MESVVSEKNKFLKNLQRYMNCGVRIYIDGEQARGKDLPNVLKISEKDGMYMGDYIEDEKKGVLKEIRFHKIRIPYKSLTAKIE